VLAKAEPVLPGAIATAPDARATIAALAPRAKFVIFPVADQVLVSGSNILFNILLARWLVKAEFGAFAILFSTFVLVTGLHNALLLEPMTVLGGGTFRCCLTSYQRHVLRMHVVLLLAFLPVLVLLGWVLVPPDYSASAFSASLLGGMAAILLYCILRRAAYISQQYGTAFVAGAANLSLALGCLFLLKTSGYLSWTTAFTTQSIAAAAASVILYTRLSKSNLGASWTIDFRTVALAHWDYGRWAVATALVFWLSAEAYCVLAGVLLGPTEAAGFRAVQNLSMLLPNFFTALSVLALPHAAARYAESGVRGLHTQVLAFLLASTVTAVVFSGLLLMTGGRVLTLLYGPGYARFAVLLPALLCNLIFVTASQGLQMGIRATNAPRYIFQAFLAAALSTCTVGIALTRIWGLQGASVGLCFSSFSFLFVLIFRYNTVCSGLLRSRRSWSVAAG
jgi:O-antigen/teichoic acid export membrane protein